MNCHHGQLYVRKAFFTIKIIKQWSWCQWGCKSWYSEVLGPSLMKCWVTWFEFSVNPAFSTGWPFVLDWFYISTWKAYKWNKYFMYESRITFSMNTSLFSTEVSRPLFSYIHDIVWWFFFSTKCFSQGVCLAKDQVMLDICFIVYICKNYAN